MPKPATVRWKPRRFGGSRKPKRPSRLSAWEIAALAALFAAMTAPWLLTMGRAPAGGRDAHRIELEATGSGYAGRFGKGRIELSFAAAEGGPRARVALFDARGAPFAPTPGTVVYLEAPGPDGGRVRVDLRPEDGALVSTRPVAALADRASLVFDEGHLRHVYALDGAGTP